MRHTNGVPKTKALVKLRELAAKHSQTSIADRIGVGQQAVSSYLRRISRPEPEVREALDREFGIGFDDWYSEEELRIAKGAPSSSPRLTGAAPLRAKRAG